MTMMMVFHDALSGFQSLAPPHTESAFVFGISLVFPGVCVCVRVS